MFKFLRILLQPAFYRFHKSLSDGEIQFSKELKNIRISNFKYFLTKKMFAPNLLQT